MVLMFKPTRPSNMNQNGDTTLETLTTMDHSLTSTMEKLHHTTSTWTMASMYKLVRRSPTSQNGDTILETHMTMDHSPTSTMEKLLLTMSIWMTVSMSN